MIGMKNSKFIKKSILLILVVVMFAMASSMADVRAQATTDNSYDVSEYRNQGTAYTYPSKEGCVFAGWYTDATYKTPLERSVKTGKAYAKFVSEDVLKVKYQLPVTTSETETTTALRLITSVESVDYQYIQFKVGYTENGEVKTREFKTKNVYSIVKGNVDGRVTINYSSNIFSEDSVYLMALKINKMPKAVYDSGLIITPQWITLDGTIVSGTIRNLKEEQGSDGTTTPLTAGLYELNAETNATEFVSIGEVGAQTSGKYGEALSTTPRGGAITVLNDCNFGTKNFTISCWIKVPERAELSEGASSYLFGTDHPGTTTGFSIQIKNDVNKKTARLRVKLPNSLQQPAITYEADTWLHLALVRDGNKMMVYLDGSAVWTSAWSIPEGHDFGNAKLAFGAYEGWEYNYHGNTLCIDDIRVYDTALTTSNLGHIKDNTDGAVTSFPEPKARITYDDGSIANTGTDRTITTGLCLLDSSKQFGAYHSTTGVDGAEYGAFVTNHKNGPYTVLKGYNFGANDFTISTWFKLPGDNQLSTDSGTYILGIDDPDTTDKFAIGVARNSADTSRDIRFRFQGTSYLLGTDDGISIKDDTWYLLSLTREDTRVSLYLDGKAIQSCTVDAGYDFGTPDLAFGAYHGVDWAYNDNDMYYDEINIYTKALGEGIPTIDHTGVEELKYYDQKGETGINTDLFYQNDLLIRGADPGVIYITEGEHKGWFFLYNTYDTGAKRVYCLKSRDLSNWEYVQECFVPDSNAWCQKDIWATEVIYDEADGKYYLFYSATNSNTSDGYLGTKYLGMAVSDSPAGPFIQYTGTNANGKAIKTGDPIFDATLLPTSHKLYNSYKNGSSFIDASPYIDPVSGDKYLYMCRNREAGDTTNIICGVKMKDWATPDYSTFTELTTVNKTTYNGSIATEKSEGVINEAPTMLYHEGTYYLTMSINATSDKAYSVIQALGDNPLGPFTKVQESAGGLVIGAESNWDHISCTGSHNFVSAGDELFIVYHQNINRLSGGDMKRAFAVDRVAWVKNDAGQKLLKASGPTYSIQPKPATYTGYINLAGEATITATNMTENSDVSYLNDGVVRLHKVDCVKEFYGKDTITITMNFDEYIKAKSLLIYNSYDYSKAFHQIDKIEFAYREMVDGKMYTKIARAEDIKFDFDTYAMVDKKAMRPGAPVILEFDEMEINQVTITLSCPTGQDMVGISEIMLLGNHL